MTAYHPLPRCLSSAFMGEAADRDRLPVVLLGGFLGSGKTTLLNALLRDPHMADTAIAVNEFGEVPLDQHLIEQDGDRTVVLANGCLCCNLAGDLEGAMMRLFARRASGALPRFRRLIVEPSGLADPAPILQAILRNPVMSRALRLDGVVTMVDALFAARQLAEHAEARRQVALADRLLLSKTDLVEPAALAELRPALTRLNPLAPVTEVRHGRIDPAELFPARFLGRPEGAQPVAEWISRHAHLLAADDCAPPRHLDATRALWILGDAPLRWPAFDAWLRQIRIAWGAEQLLRVKGLVQVAGAPDRPVVIQGVHHVLHPPVALDHWPAPGSDRRSRLVFITRGTEAHDAIRAAWDAARPDLEDSRGEA